MSDNNSPTSSFPWAAFFGFLGVVIAAYIGYLGIRAPIEIPIHATQTAVAEAKQTAAAQLFGLTPSDNSIETTPTPEIPTSLQPTEIPSDYADPVLFVQDYFALLNQRNYQEAWAKLSDKFIDNFAERGAGGYNEYIAFWDTVEQVEIASIEIVAQTDSETQIYVAIIYSYKAGYSTTGHTTYKVVKDSSGVSWLFDPN
ncbi:MAG: hypothetical protein HOP27_17995 [Anaerolineales bacterium]|nr:hypothetical protein [Anaerolineales bacterium]